MFMTLEARSPDDFRKPTPEWDEPLKCGIPDSYSLPILPCLFPIDFMKEYDAKVQMT